MVPLAPARPDLAYVNATRLEPSVLVKELRDPRPPADVGYGAANQCRTVSLPGKQAISPPVRSQRVRAPLHPPRIR